MSDHPIPREQWDRERMPDGTFRVRCSVCAKSVSTALAEPVIIRAWVMCPECIDSQAGLLQKIDAWAERERAADRVRTALSKKASKAQEPPDGDRDVYPRGV